MSNSVVFRSDNIEAILASPQAGGSGIVRLVTFESIAGAGRLEPQDLFGAPLVEKFGIDVLHVVPRSTRWYQYPEMDDCLAAIRARLTPQAIGYGSSMGGYAVAHFLDRLGLERGICLSPQASIQRAVVPFETRWAAEAAATTFRGDDALAPRRGMLWLFVDPLHAQDMAHVAAIAAAGPHRVVEVPHGGHAVGRVLVDAGCLSQMMGMFLDGGEDAGRFAELIAAGVGRSPKILVNRAREVRGSEREALLRQALALKPHNRKAVFALGRYLLQKGRAEEAQEVFRPVIVRSRREKLLARYRAMCRDAGVVPILIEEERRPAGGSARRRTGDEHARQARHQRMARSPAMQPVHAA